MGVPGADDVMLNYQSTSFHDALAVRDLLGRRPAPEFEAWLQAGRTGRRGRPDPGPTGSAPTACRRRSPACWRRSRGRWRRERETDRPDLPGTAHPAPAFIKRRFHRQPCHRRPARRRAGTGFGRTRRRGSGSPAVVRRWRHRRIWRSSWPMPAARDAVHDPLGPGFALPATSRPALAPRGLGLLAAESRAGERGDLPDPSGPGPAPVRGGRGAAGRRGAGRRGGCGPGRRRRAVGPRGGQVQVPPLLTALLERLDAADPPWRLAPTVIVAEGRVAVGDAVAAALGAAMAVVLIGERPGLSSPDSLGVYLTRPAPAGPDDRCRTQLPLQHPAGGDATGRGRASPGLADGGGTPAGDERDRPQRTAPTGQACRRRISADRGRVGPG